MRVLGGGQTFMSQEFGFELILQLLFFCDRMIITKQNKFGFGLHALDWATKHQSKSPNSSIQICESAIDLHKPGRSQGAILKQLQVPRSSVQTASTGKKTVRWNIVGADGQI